MVAERKPSELIGETLNHYRILRQLGHGGMGEVFLARDERLDRQVALKFLSPRVTDRPDVRMRFERESKTLAALNQPNIVTIHSIEESADRVFIVMEWIDGETLADRLARGPLTLDQLLAIALPLLDAVGAAHEVGIVHRDLKPSNVMIRRDGVVKVVDFGLSKLGPALMAGSDLTTLARTEALSRPGQVLGTLLYMAPEQLQGREVDARADLFALGLVLFEMATGKSPFHGDDLISRLSSILQEEPLRVATLNRDLPAELDQAVSRCLEKDPEKRTRSIAELRAPLLVLKERLAAGLYIESARQRSRQRLWRRVLVGGAAAALLGLLVWAPPGWLGRSSEPARHGADAASAVAEVTTTSVAVLPLRNLSGDADEEFFSDGVTEALIANLAKVSALRVISRNSVMPFKGSDRPIAEIAGELEVEHLLQGSVSRSDQGLMIVVQLDDPATGNTIWGETYFPDRGEIFEVQRRVVQEVARMTRVKLLDQEVQALEPRVTSPEAHELYLRGRYFWHKRTPEALQTALDLFEQALALDGSYALAHSGVAETYALMGTYGFGVLPATESAAKAREAALRALEIDPGLSEAQTALAMSLSLEWRWAESVRSFERAIELNPSNAVAHQQFAGVLTALGRHEEAIGLIGKARALDPLSLIIGQAAAATHFFAGDYEQTIALARDGLEMDSNFWVAHAALGQALSQLGKFEEADTHLRRAVELTRRSPYALASLGMNEIRRGRGDAARQALEEILAMAGQRPVPAVQVAKLYLGLGEPGTGFEWLERALANRDHTLIYLAVDPDLAPFVEDPRAVRLLARLGLGGASRTAS